MRGHKKENYFMSIFIFTDTTADFPAQLQSQFKDFDIDIENFL